MHCIKSLAVAMALAFAAPTYADPAVDPAAPQVVDRSTQAIAAASADGLSTLAVLAHGGVEANPIMPSHPIGIVITTAAKAAVPFIGKLIGMSAEAIEGLQVNHVALCAGQLNCNARQSPPSAGFLWTPPPRVDGRSRGVAWAPISASAPSWHSVGRHSAGSARRRAVGYARPGRPWPRRSVPAGMPNKTPCGE